jgi:hypothetical protein
MFTHHFLVSIKKLMTSALLCNFGFRPAGMEYPILPDIVAVVEKSICLLSAQTAVTLISFP